MSRRKLRKYSAELKLTAVQAYQAGEGSLREICRRYGIKDNRQLRNWIMCYNGHKEFRWRSAAKGVLYMTKGKKTTQQERAEIVAFCLEHRGLISLDEFNKLTQINRDTFSPFLVEIMPEIR